MRVWGLRYVSYAAGVVVTYLALRLLMTLISPVVSMVFLWVLQDENGDIDYIYMASGTDLLAVLVKLESFISIGISGAIAVFAFGFIARFGWPHPFRKVYLVLYWGAAMALLAVFQFTGFSNGLTVGQAGAILAAIVFSVGFGFHIFLQSIALNRHEREQERAEVRAFE